MDCRTFVKNLFEKKDPLNDDPMEVMYERRCAKYIYTVPEGLREIMCDISREVLRCQPKELYCFIADYLDSLLIIRENAKVAAQVVSHVIDNALTTREILFRLNISIELATTAVHVLQKAFRKYMKRKTRKYGVMKTLSMFDPHIVMCHLFKKLNITLSQATEAVYIIQHAWRNYLRRKRLYRVEGFSIDWRIAARRTINIYKKLIPECERERAATLIKAAYKGYYTRRYFKYLLSLDTDRDTDRDKVLSYLEEQYADVVTHEGSSDDDRKRESFLTKEDSCIIQKAFSSYVRTSIYQRIKDKEYKDTTIADVFTIPKISADQVNKLLYEKNLATTPSTYNYFRRPIIWSVDLSNINARIDSHSLEQEHEHVQDQDYEQERELRLLQESDKMSKMEQKRLEEMAATDFDTTGDKDSEIDKIAESAVEFQEIFEKDLAAQTGRRVTIIGKNFEQDFTVAPTTHETTQAEAEAESKVVVESQEVTQTESETQESEAKVETETEPEVTENKAATQEISETVAAESQKLDETTKTEAELQDTKTEAQEYTENE